MKILIVDETAMLAEQVRDRLVGAPALTTGSEHIVVDTESNYFRAAAVLNDGCRYDVVIVEPFPIEKGLDEVAMNIIRRAAETDAIPIAFTAAWSVARCVACMRAGAWDVVPRTRPIRELVTLVISSLLDGLGQRDVTDLDAKWVHENLAALCREYPGQWIAVSKKCVLANGDTYDEAMKQFSELPRAFEPKLWRLPVEWSDDDPDF